MGRAVCDHERPSVRRSASAGKLRGAIPASVDENSCQPEGARTILPHDPGGWLASTAMIRAVKQSLSSQ
jgi:hypothetical protein